MVPTRVCTGSAELAEAEPAQADKERRVRVSNDPGSRQDKFELLWVDEKGRGYGQADRGLRPTGGEPRGAGAAADGVLAPTDRSD